MDIKEHWDNVFATKTPSEVSWTQETPNTAIAYLENLQVPKNANIIEIGGGESNFCEILLDKGYKNIWVLDISEVALQKVKTRLGEKAKRIHWVASDITDFKTNIKFDFWYDRAVFHFLTSSETINTYVNLVSSSIVDNGNFLLGTFSENGPLKCSGLAITQYSETNMKSLFLENFEPLHCFKEQHQTPFATIQEFQFCGFKKLNK